MSLCFMTHHKCATTWLSHFLNSVAKLNNLSVFHSHFGDALPDENSYISVLTNADYQRLANAKLPPVSVHVIRNPLSVVASAYYSHLRTHPLDGWEELAHQRRLLERFGREEGMYLTLPFLWSSEFYPRTKGPLRGMVDWNYDDERFFNVRMEDLTSKPVETMRRLLAKLEDAELRLPADGELLFERFSEGRNIGSVDPSSHFRSGSPEAWRNELPQGVILQIRTFCEKILHRFYPETLD